ncbi:MAG TPA: TonB-dependent receptor [Pyrinomonadaceae bacterium]
MDFIRRNLIRTTALILALAAGALSASAQQSGAGSIRGQVMDELGGVVVGVSVTAVIPGAQERAAVTDAEGNYQIAGLPAGKYTVRATGAGFSLYENAEVEVAAGARQQLNITLGVALERDEVTVTADPGVSTDADANADALVLRDKDLDALPEDPDELAAALQALAGPSGGPNGGQIFVDGFSGGRMPSRDTIREVRINQNPFTAENDRPGFGGRIEVLTRPGTDRLRGTSYFTFMDESLNSRNPFLRSDKRPPFQIRRYGGNLSGPIKPKVASFFVDLERNEDDENDIINARVLDPITLEPTPFTLGVLTPNRRTSFSPRFDYQINAQNTLVGRYQFFRQQFQNSGLGSEFTLPTRAFDSTTQQHQLQLTETAVINQRVINETRFQFTRNRNERDGDNTIPAVNVQGAFNGGGSQVGQSFSEDTRFELQNNTTWTLGSHAFKAGARLRGVSIKDVSVQNFGGTFVFSSLDQFRSNVAGLGVGPTQFTIASGEPEADVRQYDFGGFIQDDWRVRPNLTLSAGLRYERQSNIDSNLNFAPRVAIAWQPGTQQQGQPARTVVRAGFGVFYDRVNENLTLQENRFNGSQQQFIVDQRTEAGIDFLNQVRLNADGSVAFLPALSGLSAVPQITRRLDDRIESPHTYFGGLNVERQLTKTFTAFVSVGTIRSRHLLRLRNINAPLPGTFGVAGIDPVRPFPGAGDILQYESSGVSNMNQFSVGFNTRLNPNFSIFANYTLASAKSDTDGGFGGPFGGGGIASPANSYDFSNEYGRSSFDMRHRLFVHGSFTVTKWRIQLNPFIQANSGRPFNIITGQDTNGDTLFTERPSLVSGDTCATRTALSPNVVCTRFGTFNLRPLAGEQTIQRNYGQGPNFFVVNLRIGKTFGFGDPPGAARETAANATQQPQGSGGQRGGSGGRGNSGGGGGARPAPSGPTMGGGMFMMMGGAPTEKRYNINLSINIQNIFNRANFSQPVGNLLSPDFGNSIALAQSFGFGGGGSAAAGNRKIQAQIRFSF